MPDIVSSHVLRVPILRVQCGIVKRRHQFLVLVLSLRLRLSGRRCQVSALELCAVRYAAGAIRLTGFHWVLRILGTDYEKNPGGSAGTGLNPP